MSDKLKFVGGSCKYSLAEACDKLKFVGHHSRNSGITFQVVNGGMIMATMGKYCKAYALCRFREFGQWKEHIDNARIEKQQKDGKEIEFKRELTDSSYLFLQENFTVTDGVFLDENIIFDEITSEWIDFCKNNLKFTPVTHE